MWYLLKVDTLIAGAIFSVATLVVLGLFAWYEAKALLVETFLKPDKGNGR